MESIRKLDFFGTKPVLYVNSESRYKTVFGAIMSLLTGILSLALMTYFSVRIYTRSNIFTVESREYLESQTLDLSEYNFLFQLTDYNGNLYSLAEEERMVSLSLIYFFTDKEGDPTQKEYEIPLEPCTKAHLGAKADLYASLKTLDSYYCLPLGYKLKLYGIYGGIKPFSATLITIRYCINGKFGKENCLSKSEIHRKLENFYVNLAFIDFNVQNSNINTPGVPYLRTERVQVGVNFLKRLFYEMNVVEYTSDFGYIFASNSSTSFFTVSNYNLIPDLSVDDMFLGVTFSVGRSKIKVFRYFEKFQQVLSNIGGAVKALTTSSTIFIRLAYHNKYLHHLSCAMNFKVERKKNQTLASKRSHIEFVNQIRKKENKQMNWATNLKLLLNFKSREVSDLEHKFQRVREILSSENLVKTIVEFENLKRLLFREESAVLFESLGTVKHRKPYLDDALRVIQNRERTEIEDKLFELIN